ncbi:hypothetical protein PM082_003667 [Marasmius tenuissimus]|nr:hypothetical protein PM082_003667 [Marasmius tenuissimus]
MVKVFVYPAIGYIHRRIRQNRSLRDPRALAGEDLERCHEQLKHTLDDLEVMVEEGFGSTKECENMGKLVLEHETLGREAVGLGDGLWGKRSTQPSKECLQDIAALIDNIRVLQSKVQLFSSEKKLERIKQLLRNPSESQYQLAHDDLNVVQTISLLAKDPPVLLTEQHHAGIRSAILAEDSGRPKETISHSEQELSSFGEEGDEFEAEIPSVETLKVSAWGATRNPCGARFGPST